MIKKRIIPTLLWSDNNLVKGVNFKDRRQVADMLTSIKIFNIRDVDEIIILDIDSTNLNKTPDLNSIIDFSKNISVPFTYGGGIKSFQDALDVLKSGADKVSLNSELYNDISILNKISKHTGSQSIVASVDFKKIDEKFRCVSNSGQKIHEINPIDFCKLCQDHGCGELLINAIDREGTMSGYDLEMIEKIRSNVSLPIIASGGAGSYQDMFDAFTKDISAVSASSIFSFTELTPTGAKKFLKKKKIDVRDGYRY